MNFNEKVGEVIENMKALEYYLNNIIVHYTLSGHNVSPEQLGFFENVLLNTSVISVGAKIRAIKTICFAKGENFDFSNLHKSNNLRNLFAHESSYAESTEKGIFFTMAELKSNGKYILNEFKQKYKEFFDLFNSEIKKIVELNERLLKK